MPELLRSALELSLTSLGVTFLALSVFALLITVLRGAFSTSIRSSRDAGSANQPGSREEFAAAVGLAIHLAVQNRRPDPNLGRVLWEGAGPYWSPNPGLTPGRLYETRSETDE